VVVSLGHRVEAGAPGVVDITFEAARRLQDASIAPSS
jgi:hypothetical protein